MGRDEANKSLERICTAAKLTYASKLSALCEQMGSRWRFSNVPASEIYEKRRVKLEAAKGICNVEQRSVRGLRECKLMQRRG